MSAKLSRPFAVNDVVYIKPGKATERVMDDDHGPVIKRNRTALYVNFAGAGRQWVKAHRARLTRHRKFTADDPVVCKATGNAGIVKGRSSDGKVLVSFNRPIAMPAKALRLA